MKAVVYDRYGSVDVLKFRDLPAPEPAPREILIRVRASSVTTADWRLRASAFPGGLWVIGRLMFGLFAPRNRILGGDVAGEIAALGQLVEGWSVGDAVFGHVGLGGHSGYVAVAGDGPIVPKPEALSFEAAAALPFGALAALVFLRDFGKLARGQRVLILGASGTVGVYAVQIAKAMGAHVTGVASGGNADLVRDLGADAFIDYRAADVTTGEARYDLVFDTFGAVTFRDARRVLTAEGVFLPLNYSLGAAIWTLVAGWTRRQKMIIAVNPDRREDLELLMEMIADGTLRPVIDRCFPLDEIRAAYAHVEGRRKRGSVVLQMPDDAAEPGPS